MTLLTQWSLLRVGKTFQFFQSVNFYRSRLWPGGKYRLFARKGIDAFPGLYGWTRFYCELGQSRQCKFARAFGIHLIRKHVFERGKNLGHALLAKTGSL